MNLPLISQLPQTVTTAILIVLLVIAFIVAFKIMRMVFETITVSILSGAFYFALTQLFNFSFSFNQMLTYAFLGASLYMAYAFMASAYSLAKSLLEIPYRLLKIIFIPFKHIFSKLKEEVKLMEYRRNKDRGSSRSSSDNSDDDDDSSTKEVVIDKLNKDDE